MIIRHLTLNNFGKFNNKEIELSDGINIIYGANESGKSTVHSFIKAMFFGAARQRGKAAANDEYTRFEPWENPAYYEGSIDFLYGNEIYNIHRVFQKNVKKMILTNKTQGSIVNECDTIDELIPQMCEDNFNATVSLNQADIGIDSIITNLNMSRVSDINVKSAVNYLNTLKKNIEATKPDDEIIELSSRLKEYADIDNKINDISKRIEVLAEKNNVNADKDTSEAVYKYKTKNSTAAAFLKNISALLLIGFIVLFFGYYNTGNIYMLIGAIALALIDVLSVIGIIKILFTRQVSTNDRSYDLEDTNQELERLMWELDNAMSIVNRRDELENRLKEKQRQNTELDKRLKSVSLAIKTVQKCSKSIEGDFGYQLNELASEYITRFTRGKYHTIRINADNNVTLCDEDKVVSISSVSYATKQQIHLAVRLAASKLLFGEESISILLDETFAHYDDNRMEDTLLSLSSMGTQILIFTCNNRERTILDSAGIKYNYINL